MISFAVLQLNKASLKSSSLISLEILAKTFKYIWLSLLGEANTKNRCTSSSSKELKSIPSLLTPKATVSSLALSVLA